MIITLWMIVALVKEHLYYQDLKTIKDWGNILYCHKPVRQGSELAS